MFEANNFLNNLNYQKQAMESLATHMWSSYNNLCMDWNNLNACDSKYLQKDIVWITLYICSCIFIKEIRKKICNYYNGC